MNPPWTLKQAFVSLTNNLNDQQTRYNSCLDDAYSSVLERCVTKQSLPQVKQIHTHVLKYYHVVDASFLSTKLVFAYGKSGSLFDAHKVFDEVRERTVFTWNALIGAHITNGDPFEAFQLFMDMNMSGIRPDASTFASVLKCCGELEDRCHGAQVHALAVKLGFLCNMYVTNSLIGLYAKCNDSNSAKLLFERLNEKTDVVSWNSIISAYSSSGLSSESLKMFREMKIFNVLPNAYTFVATLHACDESLYLIFGKELHGYLLKSGLYQDTHVTNALIVIYTKCGKMKEAASIFYSMDGKESIIWNSLLSGFVQNGLYDEAIELFHKMQNAGQKPDLYSIISIIPAVGRLGILLNGLEIHAYVMKRKMDSDLQVCNSLVDMYAKCGKINYAESVFERIKYRDSISWTTIISGYVQNGYHSRALSSFRQAQINRIETDSVLLAGILQVCSELKLSSVVKEIYARIIRKGVQDLVLENTLVNTYGKCGCIDYAVHVFELIKVKNVVSWTSIICCLVQNGLANEALDVFTSMKETKTEPDSVLLLALLSAVADLSALRKGKEIHGYLYRKQFVFHGPISSSLVDMYASCGCLKSSFNVFKSNEVKDLVLWTSMVNAYGMYGLGNEAIRLFNRMVVEKIHPDHVSFLAILYACSHSLLVDEGKAFFKLMVYDYGLDPWPEHYTCMVDLLGRANRLKDAFLFIKNMEIINQNASIWRSLLGACKIHCNIKLGNFAAKKLLDLDPYDIKNYVLVSNFYALSGQKDDLDHIRKKMRQKGLKKDPGCSWIEIGNKIHVFTVRDKSHPESGEIYRKLGEINDVLKRVGGYIEKDNGEMLNGHSERLAIAYGLLKTKGTPIHVTKNLRVCDDCHTFSKLVSKYYDRKIIVRDANRFHHFGFGVCSCKDLW